MAEAFWGPLCADPAELRNSAHGVERPGHGPMLGSEATGMGPAPDPEPCHWGPHSQVPRLLYRPVAHPHPSPQMVNASLCVSQCEHWGCAPQSYGAKKATSLPAQTQSGSYLKA